MSFLPYAVAAWLFVAGLYGIVTSRNLIHLVVCLTVLQSSTYVLLLAIGYVNEGKAPIFADMAVLEDLMQTGKITPVIDRTFGFSETANALRYLETGHARGKVVINLEK